MTIYADSSFFVSLYLVDQCSQEAWQRTSSGPAIWLTPLNQAEVIHAIYAHVFRNKITLHQAGRVVRNFQRSCETQVWHLLEMPARAFIRSIDLARQFGPALGVRTLDSLHVACALELKADRFWTFDERQAKLAEAVGLDTNP